MKIVKTTDSIDSSFLDSTLSQISTLKPFIEKTSSIIAPFISSLNEKTQRIITYRVLSSTIILIMFLASLLTYSLIYYSTFPIKSHSFQFHLNYTSLPITGSVNLNQFIGNFDFYLDLSVPQTDFNILHHNFMVKTIYTNFETDRPFRVKYKSKLVEYIQTISSVFRIVFGIIDDQILSVPVLDFVKDPIGKIDFFIDGKIETYSSNLRLVRRFNGIFRLMEMWMFNFFIIVVGVLLQVIIGCVWNWRWFYGSNTTVDSCILDDLDQKEY